MRHNVIEINIDYSKNGIKHTGAAATMVTYIKEQYPECQNKFNRPLIIICPGGGYEHLSPREGEAVAIKMMDLGYNAIVLNYSLVPNRYPCQMFELAYAVNYARAHAEEWDINPEKIVVAGFSAGGHVAASLGTMWNGKEIERFVTDELKCLKEDVKPNGMLLGYSVITSGKFAHRASFERLLGEKKYDELIDYVSLENRVSKDTPKTFVWHTFEDGAVPLENTLLFVNALRKENVPFEYHVFPKGSHGLALGTKETATSDGKHYQPEVSLWTQLFANWVENNL